MKELANILKFLVPAERIELSWAEARGILSPVRLPVSPRRQFYYWSSTSVVKDLRKLI